MYTLLYAPATASMAVHQTLLELAVPHELRKVDLESREQDTPAYRALNPNGHVPVLLVDGQPYAECAALLLLLAERHADRGLAPPPGDPQRALFLQWMLHLANTLQPAYRQWFYPPDFGPAEREAELKESARVRIEAAFDRLDAHLAARGPYLLGERFSVADLYATMLMRWSRNMPKPAQRWPAVAELAARIKARPSWKRLYEIEELTEWA
jgi:glutathione S-transferase